MIALIDEGLPQELFNILNVLFINDFGEHSQSICLKHVVLCDLHILGQAADDNEHFILVDIQLLDENVHEPSQILIQLVSLGLGNLK